MTKFISIVAFSLLLAACGADQATTNSTVSAPATGPLLTVYKDPNCGCCKHWITHVQEHGYGTKTIHPNDMWAVKERLNIKGNLQSCHSAVTAQGYVFEGHVPAKFMDKFLANPPADAIGLTVPAMVVGSPGMEVGDKFKAYEILLLKKDGSSELYQAIDSYQQQF